MDFPQEKYTSSNDLERRDMLIDFGKSLILNKKKMDIKDFEKHGVMTQEIKKYFKNLTNLRKLCGIQSSYRKLLMTDECLKAYIIEIKKIDANGCWITDGIYWHKSGEYRIKYNGKQLSMHRLVYMLFKGNLDPELCILHQCDNHPCFNPDHLNQGTQKQNNRECIQRGRRATRKQTTNPHNLKDPYNYSDLLKLIKTRISISNKNEWLYMGRPSSQGYAKITIAGRHYMLHRLILANKLNKKYEDINIACHRFPENSPYYGEKPRKNDVNPDHLYNGTQSQNSLDTLSYNKSCALTFDAVTQIRDAAKTFNFAKKGAVTEFDLKYATFFDVSVSTIRKIRTERSYTNLNEGQKYRGTTKKPTIQFDLQRNKLARFESATKAAKILNLYQRSISNACLNDVPYAGYLWKYE